MILEDQPDCFPNLRVAVSSRNDGSMLDRTADNRHDEASVQNRSRFCEQAGMSYAQSVYQIISYTPEASFDVVATVQQPNTNGVFADILYTETPGVALFLPIADCVGTVIYDPRRHALALAHLGRHASIAKTMSKAVEYFKQQGSDPADLVVWMSPHVAKHDYILSYFDHMTDKDWQDYASQESDGIHLDLAGFNASLAYRSGVRRDNIHISTVNTARDTHYFSHSQGDVNARFAVVAQLR